MNLYLTDVLEQAMGSKPCCPHSKDKAIVLMAETLAMLHQPTQKVYILVQVLQRKCQNCPCFRRFSHQTMVN